MYNNRLVTYLPYLRYLPTYITTLTVFVSFVLFFFFLLFVWRLEFGVRDRRKEGEMADREIGIPIHVFANILSVPTYQP